MPIVESKEAARYTDEGSPQEHCSICDHWRARGPEEGLCVIVAGTIKPTGWCRHFIHTSEAAE